MKKSFRIDGMSCSACSASVERVTSRLDGMRSVSVNLLAKTMYCDYDESRLAPDDIISAVSKAGFEASVIDEVKNEEKKAAPRDDFTPVRTRLIASFVLLAVLMYISMGHMLSFPQPAFLEGVQMSAVFAFTQLLFTLPIVYVNRKFFYSGFRALKNKSPNMDTLVAIGSLAGVLYGIFAIYMICYALGTSDMLKAEHYRHNLYFESSAMILTLVTLGKFFEERSKSKTSNALRSLERLRPETAVVERDGKEIQVPVSEVNVGDIVVLRPGTRVAFDGVIVDGEGNFDMSSLTGESVPVLKTAGDKVFSATLLTDSFVKFRATTVGKDTTLSQIIAHVENASATKAPVAKLADKISGIFVPTVIALAIGTVIVWSALGESFEFALSRAMSVLVISCPCALGLATPVAVTVSTGRLASEGILVKNASWAELMSQVKTVVFDKTGTLTHGKMQVCDVISDDTDTLVSLAAALEKHSEHPLARAIVNYAENARRVEVVDFKTVAGRGAEALYNSEKLIGGNLAFMRDNGVDASRYSGVSDSLSGEGKTVLYFALGKRMLGVISLFDSVKENSARTVAQLKKMGMRTVMLTGDSSAVAKSVAEHIGIDEVLSEVMPLDKERYVRGFSESGRVVMVGDGVNDSPSLACADIGISLGSGTDIAVDASDIVLMGSNIYQVVRVARYAKTTLKIMKQNLFWAFIYNVLGIPLAMGVFYSFGLVLSPMIGAAAMSFSSVFVVTNALRLMKK